MLYILCSWENLYLIICTNQVGMITISQIIYKSGDQHVNKSTNNDF